MKPSLFAIALAAVAVPAFAQGPAWDNSGNGLLNGAYNFRQVLYVSDGSGNINQELAYFGTIAFDGAGNYTLSGSNTLVDSNGTQGIPPIGTYSVAGSGYGFLSNPLIAGGSVYFLVSKGILLGSSTESTGSNGSFNNDLFIAAPVTPGFTDASFNSGSSIISGGYSIAGYVPGDIATGNPADVAYQLSPDGAGHLGTVTFTGYSASQSTAIVQSATNVTYSFSDGVATIPFPVGNTNMPGTETLYMSPDASFVFGGSPDGYDIFVGTEDSDALMIRPTLIAGLYYEIGLDDDESQWVSDRTANIDTYYGVFNTFSGGAIGHERLLYAGSSAESFTYVPFTGENPLTGAPETLANVGQLDPSATVAYQIGASGIRIGFGIGPWLGIEAALPAPAPTPSGAAFIDPTGIVNTASSAPFTAGISPGEFASLYNGVNLTATPQCWTAGAPFPTTLGGVQVLVNGVAAPIYCTGSGSSPTTFLVPYEVSANPIATIQVVNGAVQSNVVTAFVYKTTPGSFTFTPVGGTGFVAAEHGDYSVITPDNPAMPGETIAAYVTGLGALFPVNGVASVDGGATDPNGDNTVANIEVDVAGLGSTTVWYSGLSPDPGLYQINFIVPVNAPAGNDAFAIAGPNSYTSEALLPVGGSNTASAAAVASHRILPRLRSPAKGTIQ